MHAYTFPSHHHFFTEAVNSPSVVQYESLFITSHKAPVLAGAFSWDGQLAATGSADTTIKVCCLVCLQPIPLLLVL